MAFPTDDEAIALMEQAGYTPVQIADRLVQLREDRERHEILMRERERLEFMARLMPGYLVSTQAAECEESDALAAGKTREEIDRALFGRLDELGLLDAIHAHIEAERRLPRALGAMFQAMRFGGDRGRAAARAAAETKIAQAYGFARGFTKLTLTMAGVPVEEDLQ